MAARTTLASLSGSAPNQRLLVSLVQGPDGRVSIDLREQHHAVGIGWFDQRTMELDPKQFRQLQAVLGTKVVATELAAFEQEPPATIPFPGPLTPEPHRPAVGEGC